MSSQKYLILIVILLLGFFTKNAQAQNAEDQKKIDSANVFYQHAVDFTYLQKWDSALYYARLYEQYTEKNFVPLSNGYLNALYTLGEIYRIKNDLPAAYKYFKEGVNAYSKIDVNATTVDSGIYRLTVCRMGIVSLDVGTISEAKFYLKKGIESYKNQPFCDGPFQMNVCLANVYTTEGDYTKVDSIYKYAMEVLDTMPQTAEVHFKMASVYNNLAILYNRMGDLQKSLTFLKKCVTLEKLARKEGYYDDDYVTAELNLAQTYVFTNDIDSAWAICKDAEDSLPVKDGPLYAKLLKTKAVICQQENLLEESIELYLKYKKIVSYFNGSVDELELDFVNLGNLYTQTAQYEKADSLFRKQIASLYRQGFQYSYSMQQSVAGLCANLIDLKKYDEATDSLIVLCNKAFFVMKKNFSGMSEAEKLKYESELNAIFNLLYISISKNKAVSKSTLGEIYSLELQRKGLVLADQRHALVNAKNSADENLSKTYNDWQDNRQILAKQYSLPYKKRFLNTDSLEKINELLEKEISAKSKVDNLLPVRYKARNERISSANISFVRFSYHVNNTIGEITLYGAFISRNNDGVTAFVNLCSEKDLLGIMKNKKGEWINENQLTQNIYTLNGTKSLSFYRLVWQPIEKYVTGIKTINYSTAGLLNNVSLQALCNGKNHLVDRFNFRRFFNLSDANKDEISYQKPLSISVWGSINYDKFSYDTANTYSDVFSYNSVNSKNIKTGDGANYGSNKELQSIRSTEIFDLKRIFVANNIKCYTYGNANATEENFKKIANGMSGVLHVSTHGFYEPLNQTKTKDALPVNFIAGIENPLLRCGLALAGANYYWLSGNPVKDHDDGILSGYEIAQLDLHDVQLVTLSACETGLGDVTDNEGNIGLQTAFKLAGVNNMLVSLWEVPAKQTAELLSLFYSNWLKGQTLSTALQHAEKSMSKNYPPYFWAGFVLIQ